MYLENGIKLIVGLGNPGSRYADTRHNAGFWFVRFLVEKYHSNFKLEPKFRGFLSSISVLDYKCELLLPETFMNLSGEAVGKIVRFYKFSVSSILVIHDELDFSPGIIRLKKGGGANGHNGVQNIVDQLGDNNFWRMRIGIGKSKFKDNINDYVLSIPSQHELKEICSAIERASQIIPRLLAGDFSEAMSDLHVV